MAAEPAGATKTFNEHDAMKKVTIYYPDDAPPPNLKLFQNAVGGMIESVDRCHPESITESYRRGAPQTDPVTVAYANQEGLYRFPNSLAPREAHKALHWPDSWGRIHGPVVVCEEEAERVRTIFRQRLR